MVYGVTCFFEVYEHSYTAYVLLSVAFDISSVGSVRARQVDRIDLNPYWMSKSSLYLSDLLLKSFCRIFENCEVVFVSSVVQRYDCWYDCCYSHTVKKLASLER